MRRFGKSVVILTIVFSPIFIVGKPIVGRAEGDYYSILGLNPNSSPDEVLQAFYALSQQYNVDLTSDPNAQLRFQQIREGNRVTVVCTFCKNFSYADYTYLGTTLVFFKVLLTLHRMATLIPLETTLSFWQNILHQQVVY